MKLIKRFPQTTAICFIAFCLFVSGSIGIALSRLTIAHRAKANDTTARKFARIENVIREAGYRWVAIKELDDSIVIIATNTKGGAE